MENAKLAEFLAAQNECYGRVRKELTGGRKETHWIWFIFPQLTGLGSSTRASKFALNSLDEAKQYLRHPVLGFRLLECTKLMLTLPNQNIDAILGYPDNLKFRSCMTLFESAAPDEPLFRAALNRYFGGVCDLKTITLLQRT